MTPNADDIFAIGSDEALRSRVSELAEECARLQRRTRNSLRNANCSGRVLSRNCAGLDALAESGWSALVGMWETLLGGKGVSRSAGDVSERVLDALNKAQPEGGTREHGVAFRQREEFLAMRARWREAIAAGEQGLEHLRRALANHPNDAALQHGLLASELQHAIKLGGARRSADAQGAIDEAERLAGKLLADHPRAPVLRADAARIRGMRAEFRHSPGKTDALDEKRRVAPGMQSYTWSATKKLLAERGVELLSAGLDEVPGVKKDINAVMAAQTDHRLPDRGPARAAASSKRLEASPISAPGLAGGQRWVGGCIAFLEGTGGSTSGVQSYSKKPAG